MEIRTNHEKGNITMEQQIKLLLQHFVQQKNYLKHYKAHDERAKYVVDTVTTVLPKKGTKANSVYSVTNSLETNPSTKNSILFLVEYETDMSKETQINIYLTNLTRLFKEKNTLPIISLANKKELLEYTLVSVERLQKNSIPNIPKVTKLNLHNNPHQHLEREILRCLNDEFDRLDSLYLTNENKYDGYIPCEDILTEFIDTILEGKEDVYQYEHKKTKEGLTHSKSVIIPFTLPNDHDLRILVYGEIVGETVQMKILLSEVNFYASSKYSQMLFHINEHTQQIENLPLAKNAQSQAIINFVTDKKGILLNLFDNIIKYTEETSFNMYMSQLISIYNGEEFKSLPFLRYMKPNENSTQHEMCIYQITMVEGNLTETITPMN